MPIDHARTLAAFQQQIARLQRRQATLEQLSRRFSYVRLGVALGGGVATILAYQAGGAGWGWLTAFATLTVFTWLARRHRQVTHSRHRHALWERIKATHRARMTHDWAVIPLPQTPPPAPTHPFAPDLNLVGPRSVHHLIDTAVSAGGSARLRDWLVAEAPTPEVIRRRQELVAELATLPHYRDRLTLAGALVTRTPGEQWDGEGLIGWLAGHTKAPSVMPLLILLSLLAATTFTLVVLHFLGILQGYWAFSFLTYVAIYLFKFRDYQDTFDEALYLEQTLSKFGAVFALVERYRYTDHPHLAALTAPFGEAAVPPSAHVRRIVRIASLSSVQESEVLGPLFNGLVPWNLYFTHRLAQAKAAIRDVLPQWLDVWYDLEALSSLATFRYLNPAYLFPTLTDDDATPAFQATAMGHPLLPEADRVRNDVLFERPGEVMLITGSNMSGKSTFLRTMGLNLTLAYAGAPVDAQAMQARLFRRFTCIQVSDSLGDGISYFYAEVRRLKALLEALEAPNARPLFFLIDEIFRGTNNRERLLGSRAFLRTLAGKNGLGAVSTHDLELVHLADTLPTLTNYHFRETVTEGRMVFDYLLHPGPCPTTNALKIMAMEGLPVEHPDVPQGN